MEREHCPVCSRDVTLLPGFQAHLRAVARRSAPRPHPPIGRATRASSGAAYSPGWDPEAEGGYERRGASIGKGPQEPGAADVRGRQTDGPRYHQL
jgi:hypothetical protein